MAKEQAERKEQQVERKDPRSSAASRIGQIEILGKREDREYLVANPNDNRAGAAVMESLGWYYIDRNTDRERFRGGAPSRDAPSRETFSDQVLMWRDKAEHDLELKAKHEAANELLSRITRQGGVDAIRGSDGYFARDPKHIGQG